jgi:hypothetical protein
MTALPRLPLRTRIDVTLRVKLARLFLWLARVTARYDGIAMRTAGRIIESAERVARRSDRLRRLI